MAVSGVDKAGRDCAERRPTPDGVGQYPVIDADHRWAMIAELYQSGWSYWLIAQFCGMDPKECREALFTGGASMGARQ